MISQRRVVPGATMVTSGRRGPRTAVLALAVCGLLAALLVRAPAHPAAAQVTDDQILRVVTGQTVPPPTQIALDMRAATPRDTETVIIARDDDFADALASGVLQSLAPLYLVPSQGPVPEGVAQAIRDGGASRAIILGGTAAVSQAVEDELAGMDLVIQRRAGFSRIETAIEVATLDAPEADTIILARAFPSTGSQDPTQAYADAIAAGGLSARTGWPILLTQTAQLSEATAAFLSERQPDRVLVVGGTAAISAAVEEAVDPLTGTVERLAGGSRADTAVEIAAAGGDPDGTTTERVILVDGQSDQAWAAGVVAASHAALHDAPIILAPGGVVPPATRNFLDRGVAGISGQTVLTCVVPASVCDEVAAQIGILDEGLMSLTPAGGDLEPGQMLRVSGLHMEGEVEASGTCTSGSAVTGELPLEVEVNASMSEPCIVVVTGTDGERPITVIGQYNVSDPDVHVLAVPALVRTGGTVDILIDEPAGAELTVTATHVSASNCLDVALISPTGDEMSSLQADENCANSDSVVGPIRPVATRTRGIHRARLTMPSGGTGGALVSVAELQVRQAEIGETIEAQVDDPGEVIAYEFQAQANSLLTLAATSVNVTDCERILIYSPSQRQVGGLGPLSGCETPDHRVGHVGPLTILESGVHRMLVSVNGTGTGSYDIDVLPVLNNQIAVDSTVNARLLRPGEAVTHSFEGTAGERLAFAVTDANVNDCVRVFLLDPFGEVLDEITPEEGCQIANHRVDSGNPRTLPQTGTYTLLSYVRRGGTGRFEVHLTEGREGRIIPNGPTVAVDIDRPGRAVLMVFDGEEGDQVTLQTTDVNATDCEQIDLFDPDFEIIARLNPSDCDGSGATEGPITLPATGEYIAVGTIDSAGTGLFGAAITLE